MEEAVTTLARILMGLAFILEALAVWFFGLAAIERACFSQKDFNYRRLWVAASLALAGLCCAVLAYLGSGP